MNQYSYTPRIMTIDYRNARYQGMLNDKTNKRQGFGIVIDDDMNLYSSQWKQGQLNGMTFILMSDGKYLYGSWKDNQPNGLIVFSNKNFIIFSAFVDGKPFSQAIAISHNGNQLLVFNSEQISQPSLKQQLISCTKISHRNLLQDILIHKAQQIGLVLQRSELNICNYLSKYSRRYADFLIFNQSSKHCYFGYHNGLGLKFNINQGCYHIKTESIGHHQNYILTEIGAKYYEFQCSQEGHFGLKQTISYNKYMKRPKDKCHLLFQNMHKKSLNFQNSYFDLRRKLWVQIDCFIEEKLIKKCQEHEKGIQGQVEVKQKKQKIIPTEREQFYQQAKEDYAKMAENIKNKNRPKPYNQNVSIQKHNLSANKSTSSIHKQSTSNIRSNPINKNNYAKIISQNSTKSRGKCSEFQQKQANKTENRKPSESMDTLINDLHMVSIKQQEKRSKQKRRKIISNSKSQSKSPERHPFRQNKINKKGISPNKKMTSYDEPPPNSGRIKKNRDSTQKQIKYLKDYGKPISEEQNKSRMIQSNTTSIKQKINNEESIAEEKQGQNYQEQKNPSVLLRNSTNKQISVITEQKSKSVTKNKKKVDKSKNKKDGEKGQNIAKTPDEIQYQNEVKIRKQIYQKEIEQNLRKYKDHVASQIENIFYFQEFEEQQRRKSKQASFEREHFDKISLNNEKKYKHKHFLEQHNSQFRELEEKRNKILRDFQQMNNIFRTSGVASPSPRKYQSKMTFQPQERENSFSPELGSSRYKILEIDRNNRQRIEDSFSKGEKGFNSHFDSHFDSRNKTNKVYLLENIPDVKERKRSSNKNKIYKKRYEYYFD